MTTLEGFVKVNRLYMVRIDGYPIPTLARFVGIFSTRVGRMYAFVGTDGSRFALLAEQIDHIKEV